MSDREPTGLDYSREQVAKHYSTASWLAEKERFESAGYVDQIVSNKDEYVRFASSPKKEDRDEAARIRSNLKFAKLDLWRATNVNDFLRGKKCVPGSEFLTYAWLIEQDEDLKLGLKNEEKSYSADSVAKRQNLNDKITAVSSCIVDMGRRFPAGIATFRATESFLNTLPSLVQGTANIIRGHK